MEWPLTKWGCDLLVCAKRPQTTRISHFAPVLPALLLLSMCRARRSVLNGSDGPFPLLHWLPASPAAIQSCPHTTPDAFSEINAGLFM